MAEEDDQFLRELYNQGHPNREVEPPDFDEVMSRARASTQRRPWQRRPVWMGAAAAAVVAAFLGFALLWPDLTLTDDEPDPSTVIAESVEPQWDDLEPAPAVESLAVEDQERWEELLEFADEIWEWESPTDFLL